MVDLILPDILPVSRGKDGSWFFVDRRLPMTIVWKPSRQTREN